ncbi:four helix bundle protein [Thermodesulfobacteriota bacterium]
MKKVERFEDLVAWQKARELMKQIYFLTNKEPFSKDFGLRDQIRRASVSIMSNLAEGFERSGRPEFHQFVVIAKGSCAEVRSQLYVALDVGCITQECFDQLFSLAIEVSRILGGLRSALQKQRDQLK